MTNWIMPAFAVGWLALGVGLLLMGVAAVKEQFFSPAEKRLVYRKPRPIYDRENYVIRVLDAPGVRKGYIGWDDVDWYLSDLELAHIWTTKERIGEDLLEIGETFCKDYTYEVILYSQARKENGL